MSDEKRVTESFTKSFKPGSDTVRSFTGGPSEPTPLPAETPYAISGDGGSGGDPGAAPAIDAGSGSSGAGGDSGTTNSDSD